MIPPLLFLCASGATSQVPDVERAKRSYIEFLEAVNLARPNAPFSEVTVDKDEFTFSISSPAYGSAHIRNTNYKVVSYTHPSRLKGDQSIRVFQPKFNSTPAAELELQTIAKAIGIPRRWQMEAPVITSDTISEDLSDCIRGTVSTRFVKEYYIGTSVPANYAEVTLDAMTGELLRYDLDSNVVFRNTIAKLLPAQAIYLYYGMSLDDKCEIVSATHYRYILPEQSERVWFEEVTAHPVYTTETSAGGTSISEFHIAVESGVLINVGGNSGTEYAQPPLVPSNLVAVSLDSPIMAELLSLVRIWLKDLGEELNETKLVVMTIDNRHFSISTQEGHGFLWRRGDSGYMLYRQTVVAGELITDRAMRNADDVSPADLQMAQTLSGMRSLVSAYACQATRGDGVVDDLVCLIMQPEDYNSGNEVYHFDRTLVRLFGKQVIEVVRFPKLQQNPSAAPKVTNSTFEALIQKSRDHDDTIENLFRLADRLQELEQGDQDQALDNLRMLLPRPEPVEAVTPFEYVNQDAPTEQWMWKVGPPDRARFWSHPQLEYLFWDYH